ncbi:hypothetical protein [Sedimenticola selenatireducens]|uniref:hypothetical protein n=1 Tax=Sedimenticola selenatireducens TaxID=191960 RepID=UPI002355F648|nr:hypothetical protein [Sedimenticola selenatireducens]
MDRFISLILFLALLSPLSYAGEPQRDKGISVHALPKRVADISDQPWGFQVSYAAYLKPEPGQPVLQSLNDVLEYINKQDQSVIENGLWVVTTHPSSYSESEIELQNKVKAELPKNNIPLFWVRGSQLKNGFKRY